MRPQHVLQISQTQEGRASPTPPTKRTISVPQGLEFGWVENWRVLGLQLGCTVSRCLVRTAKTEAENMSTSLHYWRAQWTHGRFVLKKGFRCMLIDHYISHQNSHPYGGSGLYLHYFILSTIQPQFTDKEAEPQKVWVICLRSHS